MMSAHLGTNQFHLLVVYLNLHLCGYIGQEYETQLSLSCTVSGVFEGRICVARVLVGAKCVG